MAVDRVAGDTEHAIQEVAAYIALEEQHNDVEAAEDNVPKVLHVVGTAGHLVDTRHMDVEGQCCSGGGVADIQQEA